MGKAASEGAKELNTVMAKDNEGLRTADAAVQGAENYGRNVVNNLGDVSQVAKGMNIPQQQPTQQIDYNEILKRYLGGGA